MEEIRCSHCGEKERQNKQGKIEAGSQRYRCRDCNRVYTPNANYFKHLNKPLGDSL